MKLNTPKPSKYKNRITEVDGIKFDSKAEANHYQELKLLVAAGEITELTLQPKYVILDSYRHPTTAKKIAATYYRADFLVKYKDGREEIIDVKGKKTDVYMLKRKMFEARYGKSIVEVMA